MGDIPAAGTKARHGDPIEMHHAANAYARTSRAVMTPREAEAAVLIKAAHRIQALNGGEVEASPELSEALAFNGRVWTLLATAAVDPANPLPADIRAGVANLAAYALRTGIDAMIAPTQGKLDALVTLNHRIAAGLQTATAAPPSRDPMAA